MRKQIDLIILFKMLILHQFFNFSDHELGFQLIEDVPPRVCLSLRDEHHSDSAMVALLRVRPRKVRVIEELSEMF